MLVDNACMLFFVLFLYFRYDEIKFKFDILINPINKKIKK